MQSFFIVFILFWKVKRMGSVYTIVLYGTKSSRESARVLLENQPQIRRIDSLSDMRILRLITNTQIDEISLIPLLSASGISGFRLIEI